MSNTVRLTVARKTARANLMIFWCADATLALYDGVAPDDADTAISTQVKCAEFTLPTAPAGTVADGVFTLASGTAPALALANATVSWARLSDGVGDTIGDYDVGEVGSGAAVEIGNPSLVTGATVSLVSFTQAEG
jgi:hypothetical protein